MASSRFNLAATLSIVLSGIVAAIVCFGFLRSSASTDINGVGVSTTGAIAGFLAAATFTGTLFRQLQKASMPLEQFRLEMDEENKELRKQVAALQQKVIREAPRPAGFQTEVDERHRVVLARPSEWTPMGANIFAFECPPSKLKEGDIFAPYLQFSYELIDVDTLGRQSFYEQVQERFHSGVGRFGGPNRAEMISIGGDLASIPSLKLMSRTYVRVLRRRNALTGELESHSAKGLFIPAVGRQRHAGEVNAVT